MAFVIYYFKDKTLEVGKIDWTSAEDQQHRSSKMITQCPRLDDEDGWMNVKWDKGRKKKDGPALFPAKVLMISELPVVFAKMKEVIENVAFQTSTLASNWSTSITSVGSPVSACVSPQVVSDDMVCLLPGSNVEVPRRKLNSLRTANSSVYIGDLAVLVYGRETLSHSSLTGRQSGAHKDVESKPQPQFNNTKLDAIIGHALSKFPDISVQDVRCIIRKKSNNKSYTRQATAKKTMKEP
ncbi:hypothetical protein AOLI_G00202720 [Acnodon oligacanthus]